MRLLTADSLQFEEYFDLNTPSYAILSHRWEAGEVAFKDVDKANRKGGAHLERVSELPGMKKVSSFARQALRDGHQYIWVDTCCIDKTSSAELQESINSMFKWYQKAAVCYAYLSDVPSAGDMDAFAASKWFTRGWTLQELLAPREVLFFDRGWNLIGARYDLLMTLESITGIHDYVLFGHTPLRRISVATRMSWAASRETTREEDQAYCLLGIFDINMALLYGEGPKAFSRLQEEIMRVNGDTTLLSWGPDLLQWRNSYAPPGLDEIPDVIKLPGPLSPSLALFKGNNVYPGETGPQEPHATSRLTQRGLELTLPLVQDLYNPQLVFVVVGNNGTRSKKVLVLPLLAAPVAFPYKAKPGEYIRVCPPLFVSSGLSETAALQQICIPRGMHRPEFKHLPLKLNDAIPEAYRISFCYPPQVSLPLFHSVMHNTMESEFTEQGTRIVELVRHSDSTQRAIVTFEYAYTYHQSTSTASATLIGTPSITVAESPLDLELARSLAKSEHSVAIAQIQPAGIFDSHGHIIDAKDTVKILTLPEFEL